MAYKFMTKEEKEAYRKELEAKNAELNEKLEAGIRGVYNSEEWANYLKMYRNFANYSTNNKILVMLQKPDATMVKGFMTWKNEFGRSVIKGETGITIFKPMLTRTVYTTEDILKKLEENPSSTFWQNLLEEAHEAGGSVTRETFRFGSERVFDVSQTTGKELPPHTIREPLKEKVTDYETLFESLKGFAEGRQYASEVRFATPETDPVLQGAYGYYRPSTKEIVLREGMSESMTIKVLVHEIAHSMLHGKEMFDAGLDNTSFIGKRDIKEIQAESVAFIMCDSLGIDSSCDSFGYIATYANEDMDKLRDNLKLIDLCANELLDGLGSELEKQAENLDLEDDYEVPFD